MARKGLWYGEVLVDLIYRPVGLCIDRELIESCPYRNVQAIPVRVLSVEDVLATKVLSLTSIHRMTSVERMP